ncbi:MAG: M23 family metallopeptidase [Dermatophilaceae bacterium]
MTDAESRRPDPPGGPAAAAGAGDPLVLRYPFTGRWLARNSPARRVPSHGSDLLGTTYAIDFVPVDDRGRPARRTWRTLLATEPVEAFVGFGAPVLSPVDGTVALVHDGETDHEARRSLLTLVPYLLTQGRRARAGAPGLAGNHVAVAMSARGPYVLLAHLRRGSLRVRPGDAVRVGHHLGDCGNSGNSTQPHVHVQVTDSTDWPRARGLPIAFRGRSSAVPRLPRESEIVEV